MGNVEEDRTFKVNFSSEGAANLKEKVNDKLKEFMGDYTDDTLVEYVIVLLSNGRCKDEARNELNVFLGDDSRAFVSWLWDHLALNLNSYVQSQDSSTIGVSKTKPSSKEYDGKSDMYHMDSGSDGGKTNSELPRSRRRREWKGVGRGADEGSHFGSSNVENVPKDGKDEGRVNHKKQSLSPRSSRYRKRNWHDEQYYTKDEISKATSNAPRRLLQFAVRDAVFTKMPVSKSTAEPSSKRLRSVVSTSTGETSSVLHQRIQSETRMPNNLHTVIKAAAEDVTKVCSSGSVFDRLGRGVDAARTREGHAEFIKSEVFPEETEANFFERSNYNADNIHDMISLEDDKELDFDYVSVEGYRNDADVMGNRVAGPLQTGKLSGSYTESFQHKAIHANDVSLTKWTKNQNQSAVTAVEATNKLLKVSASARTPKQQCFETPNGKQVAQQKSVQESKLGTNDSGLHLSKGNRNSLKFSNANAQHNTDSKEDPLKVGPSTPGLCSGARPLEDIDSRTIFVSNVHFAASKDDLSRHFNKFGDVVKVVILTDAATGQPKGAAYVEFMQKEAADDSLSMDGTSFMSRILKVVERSSAQQEAGAMMSWPRATRASPFPASRFRYPFPGGISGTFRSRPPIKAGARSFQWKRNAQETPAEVGISVSGSRLPALNRSLTYVRAEAGVKPNGN